MNRTKEDIAKSVARKRAERCKHFNGVQHDKCEAGVCYKELEAQGALPCLPYFNDKPDINIASCANRAVFTPEEIEKQERELNEHLGKIEKVMASIVQYRKQVRQTKQSWQGVIDCAACGGKGTLFVGIASYNGHARGKCKACDVAWIE